jgi:hypothetical protein
MDLAVTFEWNQTRRLGNVLMVTAGLRKNSAGEDAQRTFTVQYKESVTAGRSFSLG